MKLAFALCLIFLTLHIAAMEESNSPFHKAKKWLKHLALTPINQKKKSESNETNVPHSVEIPRKSALDKSRASEMHDKPNASAHNENNKPLLYRFFSHGASGMHDINMSIIIEAFEQGRPEIAEKHMSNNKISPLYVFARALNEKKYTVAECVVQCKEADLDAMLLDAVIALTPIYKRQKEEAKSLKKLRDKEEEDSENVVTSREKVESFRHESGPIYQIIKTILSSDRKGSIDGSKALKYAIKHKIDNVKIAIETNNVFKKMQENADNNVKRLRENSMYRKVWEEETGVKFSEEDIEIMKAKSFSEYTTTSKEKAKQDSDEKQWEPGPSK